MNHGFAPLPHLAPFCAPAVHDSRAFSGCRQRRASFSWRAPVPPVPVSPLSAAPSRRAPMPFSPVSPLSVPASPIARWNGREAKKARRRYGTTTRPLARKAASDVRHRASGHIQMRLVRRRPRVAASTAAAPAAAAATGAAAVAAATVAVPGHVAKPRNCQAHVHVGATWAARPAAAADALAATTRMIAAVVLPGPVVKVSDAEAAECVVRHFANRSLNPRQLAAERELLCLLLSSPFHADCLPRVLRCADVLFFEGLLARDVELVWWPDRQRVVLHNDDNDAHNVNTHHHREVTAANLHPIPADKLESFSSYPPKTTSSTFSPAYSYGGSSSSSINAGAETSLSRCHHRCVAYFGTGDGGGDDDDVNDDNGGIAIAATELHRKLGNDDGTAFQARMLLCRPALQNARAGQRLVLAAVLHEAVHAYLFIRRGPAALAHAAQDGGHTPAFLAIARLIDDWLGDPDYLCLAQPRADMRGFRAKSNAGWDAASCAWGAATSGFKLNLDDGAEQRLAAGGER